MQIGGILLAAGGSTRLGHPKQLLTLNNQTLVERAVDTMQAALLQPIVVVTGSSSQKVTAKLKGKKLIRSYNENWESGMSSSIKIGLQKILSTNTDLQAVLICLCDQPFLTFEHLQSLIDAYKKEPQKIIVSYYHQLASVPAIFPQSTFPILQKLQGQQGARKVIRELSNQVQTIDFPDGIYDVDTKSAWLKVQRKFAEMNDI